MSDLKERVLEDDYPIYGDYVYVVDGNLYRSDYHDVTVGWLKRKLEATEIRSCDLIGRQRAAYTRTGSAP